MKGKVIGRLEKDATGEYAVPIAIGEGPAAREFKKWLTVSVTGAAWKRESIDPYGAGVAEAGADLSTSVAGRNHLTSNSALESGSLTQ